MTSVTVVLSQRAPMLAIVLRESHEFDIRSGHHSTAAKRGIPRASHAFGLLPGEGNRV